MTGAADSLDTGLVSEPVERRKPRIEAEYAFDAGSVRVLCAETLE